MIPIHALARKTRITVRTLRYYDSIGLLRPSGKTPGGHRLYAEEDVVRLYKIMLLKSLGFGLNKVKTMLDGQDSGWEPFFRQQLHAIREQRIHLETMERKMKEIETIFKLEGELKPGLLYELIALSQQNPSLQHQFVEHTFSPDERTKIKNIPSFSGCDEESEQWIGLYADIRNLAGKDPASEEAQRVVERIISMTTTMLGGDERLMQKLWEIRKSPEQSRQMRLFPLEPETIDLLDRAFAIYEANRPSYRK
ncbi:MerR family transcriptional regulator [Paenibacillus ehimensis]|uniref:MerR family transcriptional regulator n=1 Tax=Paenibacillus ehimensis TaxID=79264 RepID=UPI003D2D7CD2